IRQAALEGLAALDAKEAIDPILKDAEPGHMARTRPAAIKAAGRLVKLDPDRVFAALEHYLADPEDRTRRAAAEALAASAQERARKPLEQVVASSSSEVERAAAQQCIRDLDVNIKEAGEKKGVRPGKSAWVSPNVR